ncbi:MAG: ABC transporter permease [Acidimicrobiales bacterium]
MSAAVTHVTVPTTGVAGAAVTTAWPEFTRRLLRQKRAMAGAAFLVFAALACYVGAHFVADPDRLTLGRTAAGPSLSHPFGTDELGRDQLARVLRGGQISLAVGAGVAALSTLIGTAVGVVAGYYRGRVDEVLMRVVDVVLIIPLIVAAIVLSSVENVGPVRMTGTLRVMLILALWMWAPIARIVRGAVYQLRDAEFVEAARAAGASDRRIIVRHIVPNAAGSILVAATLAVVAAILTESALSFLGFGAQPPAASWGRMLSGSVSSMELYPWLAVFPGLAIFLTALAISFLGDGLRDAFDVKLPIRR